MVEPVRDFALKETPGFPASELVETPLNSQQVLRLETRLSAAPATRSSLKASTCDGLFSTVFGCASGGVLLANFLLQLGATHAEIGLLSAIPMLVNCLQLIGAYFADRTNSRRNYNLWVFGLSRFLWLMLCVAISWAGWSHAEGRVLVQWTLGIVLLASILGALGTANWLSWMTVLVPQRLRGRYFGFRNSAMSLVNLVGVPLMGVAVTAWGGAVQGYGIVLFLGVMAGLVGVACQWLMADVNPQIEPLSPASGTEPMNPPATKDGILRVLLKDANFLIFLLYFGLWTFAVNLSAPFFNVYLLDYLALDVRWVTLYGSLSAGATLLMLLLWGRLADRFGNRPLLIGVGLVVAITPILWLGTGFNALSLWVGLPLLHVLGGGTWGAIDLCSNNIQMEIAPKHQPSTYFAIAAAVAGVAGALGTTAGGFLAELPGGSLGNLFALSSVGRLLALFPLLFVQEARSFSLRGLIPAFGFLKPRSLSVPAVQLAKRP